MKKNSTLVELLIGIFVVGILAQIVCFIFFEQHLYDAIGLWVGVIIAAGMAIHMQRSIEDGLDLMGDSGAKHMQKASATRMLVACVVMAVVLYKKWGNPVTLLVGVMALKLAAYMQPLVHRFLRDRKFLSHKNAPRGCAEARKTKMLLRNRASRESLQANSLPKMRKGG